MKCLVFVGGFSETIELFELEIDLSTPGDTRLKYLSSSNVGKNPAFLALDGQNIYCVHEVSNFKGENCGGFSYMKLDEANKIRKIQEQFSSGEDPTHVLLNVNKKCAYISNYLSGHFAVTKIKENGMLGNGAYIESFESGSGVVKDRQKDSHPHGSAFKGDFVYCVDLGADCIRHYEHGKEYEFSAAAKTSTGPGTGPRHMTFHPKHDIAYVITELSNEVITYKQSKVNGSLVEIARQSFLDDTLKVEGVTNYGSEIMVHPNGKYLYLSNRALGGKGSLIAYEITDQEGTLKKLEVTSLKGTWPRHFNIDPSGKVLLCADQFVNSIEVFYVDDHTGKVEKVEEVECSNSPSCIVFK